jgi:hypothetical protein
VNFYGVRAPLRPTGRGEVLRSSFVVSGKRRRGRSRTSRPRQGSLLRRHRAREQGARSFGLQAALKLAKLYQSTSRPADARAVLAPALERFSPTPEMPEIEEAQTLLGELSNPSVGEERLS